MIKLYKNGAWLTEGQEPVSDETGLEQKFHLSKQEAKKNTIAYSILKNHNTSENMDFLKLKFDKLTSHDITFVGIIPDSESFRTGEISGSLCTYKLSQFSVCSGRNH